MFRENVHQEDHKVFSINIPVGCDKQCHFGESTDDDQDSVITVQQWEAFYEVHGDRVPRSYGNQKEPEQAERLVVDQLASAAG